MWESNLYSNLLQFKWNFTDIKVKQNVSQQLRRQTFFYYLNCFSVRTCEISRFTYCYCIRGGMVSRDPIVNGDWRRAGDWCKIAKKFGVGFRCAAYSPVGNFELILTAKLETRHPAGGPFVFGREFSAFLITAKLWRIKVARPEIFLAIFVLFWKNDLLR